MRAFFYAINAIHILIILSPTMTPTLSLKQSTSTPHSLTPHPCISTSIPHQLLSQPQPRVQATDQSAMPVINSRLAKIPEEFRPAQKEQDKQIKSSEPRMQSRSTLSSSDNNHDSNFEATPEKNIISKHFYPSKAQIQNIFFKFAREGDFANLNKLLEKFKYQLNIDAYDFDGETALTKVAKLRTKKEEQKNPGCGRPDLVNLLISFGADLNKPNKAGDTPLIIATKAGHTSIVRQLLEKRADPQNRADPHLADSNKYTALKWAAHLGRSAIIEELIFNRLSQYSKQVSEYSEFTGAPYFKTGTKINAFDNQVHYNRRKQVDEAYRFGLTGKVDPHQLGAKIQMKRALEFADEVWLRRISEFDMKDFEQALCIAKAQGNDWTVQVLRAHGVNEGDQIELDHPSDSSSSLV